jgi:hypothetical protein
MKALREYFKELGNYGIDPEMAITELGFDDSASYPKITFKQKGFVPDKAMNRVETMLDSDPVKVATREISPAQAGPALAAPQKSTMLNAPASQPVDEAYEEEAPSSVSSSPMVSQEAPPEQVTPKSTKEKPTVAPVKASDELSAKLDSLFDE